MDNLVNELLNIEIEEQKINEKQELLLVANKIFDEIKALDNEVKRLKDLKANVREQMTQAMAKAYNGTNDVFEIDGVRIKYTPPTTRKSVDTNILKATYPDIYKVVLKESPVKDKVTITFRENKQLEVKE